MEAILGNDILVLMGVVLGGCALGLIRVHGISFGSTACLFTGLAAGAMGAELPHIIEKIGILFFVYSIGLSVGPRFFHLFKGKTGLKMIALSICTIAAGVLVAAVGSLLFRLPDGTFIGVFAGAITSTPTLASALAVLSGRAGLSAGKISVAYTVAYPVGFLLIVLFVQYVPRIFRARFEKELSAEREREAESGFQTRAFILENKGFLGKCIDDLGLHRFCSVNITRIKRREEIIFVRPDLALEEGDVAVVVGLPEELAKFEVAFGRTYEQEVEPTSEMNAKDMVLANTKFANVKLSDLKLPSLYGVTITRIRRSGRNITPQGKSVLEMGDEIRVFGSAENVGRFAEAGASQRGKLDETNIVILSLGMFAGLVLGLIPFKIGRVNLTLGAVGGPLLVSLLLGHFGKIGPWSVRLPIATRIFLREFGLVFFLSSVGVSSGGKLVGAMQSMDVLFFAVIAAVTALATMTASYLMASKVLDMTVAGSLGAVCGSMTSTPALGVLINKIEDDSPTLTYAAVYPIATILLAASGQFLVWVSLIIAALE